jgi:hypothetical protein
MSVSSYGPSIPVTEWLPAFISLVEPALLTHFEGYIISTYAI